VVREAALKVFLQALVAVAVQEVLGLQQVLQ
jgi:hypothetical protein